MGQPNLCPGQAQASLDQRGFHQATPCQSKAKTRPDLPAQASPTYAQAKPAQARPSHPCSGQPRLAQPRPSHIG